MPLYEYRCEECGEDFELLLRSLSQKDDATCPRCGSQRVKKVISLFGAGGAARSKTAASCSPAST